MVKECGWGWWCNKRYLIRGQNEVCSREVRLRSVLDDIFVAAAQEMKDCDLSGGVSVITAPEDVGSSYHLEAQRPKTEGH